MFSSFRIGTLFGITVRVHFLFLVMLLLLGPRIGPEGGPFGILILLGLFGLVLLHELGHSLVAMRFGIRVVDITLWPLGGMARLSHIPESSRIEAWIAVAGPAVNIAIALVAAPFLALPYFHPLDESAAGTLLAIVVFVNVLMAGFNLLPAFPTDGGRLVRAWFARKHDWSEATERAVTIGRITALVIGAVGIAWGNWMVPVIALWLWWMSGVERAQVRTRRPQVGAITNTPVGPIPFTLEQAELTEEILAGREGLVARDAQKVVHPR